MIKLERRIYYCDYCGRVIKHRPKTIRTVWSMVTDYLIPGSTDVTSIEGDGCKDCYESYVKWVNIRKEIGKASQGKWT